MPPDVYSNSTTPEQRSPAAVENIGEDDSQTVTIVVSLSVVAVILGVCAIMCYREVNRRRKETLIVEEFARRESIKKSIQEKLQQLQCEDESDSYKEHMETKVPAVTFSEVVQINTAVTPYSSTDELNTPQPPSPQPRQTRKRPQRSHHMYQSYFDNIVKTQEQTRKIVVKLQQQQQEIAAKEANQTAVLLPSQPSVQLSRLDNIIIEQSLLVLRSSNKHLKDDISQHPLGIPLKKPRRSLYTFISGKLHRRPDFSSPEERNSTSVALVKGSQLNSTNKQYSDIIVEDNG
ncbi:hypothetical protein BgiMline_011697 [Biomphalaria glabrata]|uniref:Uncharacterized protein LOC106054108 n=1 Tax=Biomphalaria glabrata TaxID=6526 RepID=A0A9W3A5I3_BIOGL|nr:uncharacterized protein LOC106054108 [Biomphalaria glabrata]XP_013065295.2 uncharacterized protein LOC106054108 [Biomphalaria glabrata]XP_055882526.1 uncharacterized protein LOC106054108 [Biomphalaria glabrata]KAI8733227.1 hypothetical protein BgiMline_029172 [Biomphalaria glabrata]